MIQRPRGTQDMLNMTLFAQVTRAIEEVLIRAGFCQIDTPLFESIDLFKRSLGLHTDIVSKEMFVLQPRSEEQELLCLRPELTAPIARTFIEHSIQTVPWKVFSIGAVFRYERPQKGRFRQFHQISIESIGTHAIGYDAQLLALLHHLFSTIVPVGPYTLQLNFLGCIADRTLYKNELQQFLKKHVSSICTTCVQRTDTNTLRVFDCKVPACQQLYHAAPLLTDQLCTACSTEWQQLQQYLNALSIPFSPVPHLVRGLDYYNKTAFEFVSAQLGAQSTFCGGGRYDQLLEQLGAKQGHPALGAGIGIERVLMLHESYTKNVSPTDAYVIGCIPLESQYIPELLRTAQQLIQEGTAKIALFLDGSLKSSMKKADKQRCTHVLLIGTEEAKAGKVTIKHMQTGTQVTITAQECIERISLKQL